MMPNNLPDPHAADASAGKARYWHRIADASALLEGGDGIRFDWRRDGLESLPAFCIRFEGQVRAYLNQCAHIPVELDWQPGKFFDDSGQYLICTTHGATYEAASGECIAGPCRGRRLRSLEAREEDGAIWVRMTIPPTTDQT